VTNPEDNTRLLHEARSLLRDDDALPGVTELAVATVARQVLEDETRQLCARWDPAWSGQHITAQLLCLPRTLGDRQLAVEVSHCWKQLTHVCHHRPYALTPAHEQLHAWLDTVERLVSAAGSLPEDLEREITLGERAERRAA
jgi:phytoene dehydrogenase-like protein